MLYFRFMQDKWKPIFVLPNVQLNCPIGDKNCILVPATDRRVVWLKNTHPNFKKFLGKFSDNFGVKFEPPVLMVHSDALSWCANISAISSFRDLIAISAIVHGRSLLLRTGVHNAVFGETFEIYPWSLDKQYEHVIGNTPAILGLHDVEKLRAQSSPSLSRQILDIGDFDQTLLANLLKRWSCRYKRKRADWEDVALFRSLNMAYHASKMPAGTDTTFYDVGRIASLWVSAFEILVHPGGMGQANRDKVLDLIERTPWELKNSARKLYNTSGKSKIKRSLASSLYEKLNNSRNDFLHGNPVKRSKFVLSKPKRPVSDYAASIYRLALTVFLPLVYEASDAKALGALVSGYMNFIYPQRYAEQAILSALLSSDEKSKLSKLKRAVRRTGRQ